MSNSAVYPGKLLRKGADDKAKVYLLIAMHDSAGFSALAGFSDEIPSGKAVIAEARDGNWRDLGPRRTVELDAILRPPYQLVPRRGAPLTFLPQGDPTADSLLRQQVAAQNLEREGGKRQNFRLSGEAIAALNAIRSHWQQDAGVALDDTEIISRLIAQEAQRLSRRK